MSAAGRSVFLERQSYRRRRLIDTIRILPLLGVLLWAVPLLWQSGEDATLSTADAIIYIFLVWGSLVAATGLLAFVYRRVSAQADEESGQ